MTSIHIDRVSEAAARTFEPSFLEALRDRVPVSQVVGQKVRLVRKGREFQGLCPFHGEKTPSFTVNDGKGFYHCFGCGVHGDIFGFLMETQGLGFVEAVEAVSALAGLDPDSREAKMLPPPDNAANLAADGEHKRKSIEKARDLFFNARPAAGTPVETYLRRGRGIDLDAIGGMPITLRCAYLEYWDTPPGHDKPISYGRYPCQVGAMQIAPGKGGICGAHVTYLRADGLGKAEIVCKVTGKELPNKKMQGQHRHASTRFAAAGPILALAEGIETALSCRVAGGQGFLPGALPIWAGGSLDNLAGYPMPRLRGLKHPEKPRVYLRAQEPDPERPGIYLPPEVRTIILCEDADSGDRHLAQSIYDLATVRWTREGRRVLRARPRDGMDFNDMLRGAE